MRKTSGNRGLSLDRQNLPMRIQPDIQDGKSDIEVLKADIDNRFTAKTTEQKRRSISWNFAKNFKARRSLDGRMSCACLIWKRQGLLSFWRKWQSRVSLSQFPDSAKGNTDSGAVGQQQLDRWPTKIPAKSTAYWVETLIINRLSRREHVEIVVLFSKGEISSKKEKVGFITEAE